MQIRAVSGRNAFSQHELNELVDFDFGQLHTLWAVGSRKGSLHCLVSWTWGSSPRIYEPSWRPLKAFEVFEIALAPHWIFATSVKFTSEVYWDEEWDWVMGDEYFIANRGRLLDVLGREDQALAAFYQHAQASVGMEETWLWRCRIDKVRHLLSPDETVQALALVEAAEYEILGSWLLQLET